MKPTKKTGTLYRAVYENFKDAPLPSRSERGRFHDEATKHSTTYLAASSKTAWAEVTHRWAGGPSAYRMIDVRVNLGNIIDLTDPTVQMQYRVDRTTLTADDYTACQDLARRLRANGVEGLWTYSRADQPEGRQLVVFLDQLEPGSEVKILAVRSIAL